MLGSISDCKPGRGRFPSQAHSLLYTSFPNHPSCLFPIPILAVVFVEIKPLSSRWKRSVKAGWQLSNDISFITSTKCEVLLSHNLSKPKLLNNGAACASLGPRGLHYDASTNFLDDLKSLQQCTRSRRSNCTCVF